MNEATKKLEGSVSRDRFKRKHKELSGRFYGADLDFVLVQKEPIPDIVCALDYKKSYDCVTFSEVILYNALIMRGVEVFIVTGDADSGIFAIQSYLGGHHELPNYTLGEPVFTNNWSEFEAWENEQRKKRHAFFKKTASQKTNRF